MSIRFETRVGGTDYSVRQAGGSLRLYSNGVFHSQWNPARPFAGGIWDCLSLPSLYRERSATRRILLLGVGGGAVIRQLECLLPFESLIGLDRDATHLQIARDWFGVADARVTLVEADAHRWLQRYRGARFDLVIDDLFGHEVGEPVRAVPLSALWVETLAAVLADDGLLAVNAISGAELKAALPGFVACGLHTGHRWTQPTYDNAIGVLHGRGGELVCGRIQHLAPFGDLPLPARHLAVEPVRRDGEADEAKHGADGAAAVHQPCDWTTSTARERLSRFAAVQKRPMSGNPRTGARDGRTGEGMAEGSRAARPRSREKMRRSASGACRQHRRVATIGM